MPGIGGDSVRVFGVRGKPKGGGGPGLSCRQAFAQTLGSLNTNGSPPHLRCPGVEHPQFLRLNSPAVPGSESVRLENKGEAPYLYSKRGCTLHRFLRRRGYTTRRIPYERRYSESSKAAKSG